MCVWLRACVRACMCVRLCTCLCCECFCGCTRARLYARICARVCPLCVCVAYVLAGRTGPLCTPQSPVPASAALCPTYFIFLSYWQHFILFSQTSSRQESARKIDNGTGKRPVRKRKVSRICKDALLPENLIMRFCYTRCSSRAEESSLPIRRLQISNNEHCGRRDILFILHIALLKGLYINQFTTSRRFLFCFVFLSKIHICNLRTTQ